VDVNGVSHNVDRGSGVHEVYVHVD
jgi:hypothetical protein